MHASEVLQTSLKNALTPMHALRRTALLQAVDALTTSRRLTLSDLARSCPSGRNARPAMKAFDRLLSNPRLQSECVVLYRAMAHWLTSTAQPVIIVDWSELKADRSWHLLRAAVPVGGRTLTILDQVFPDGWQADPKAHQLFLARLAQVIPQGVRPILVTDAGFRAPWFRAVEAMGWDWVGRLRHQTQVNRSDDSPADPRWVPCSTLHRLARRDPRDLGVVSCVKKAPLTCRLIALRHVPKGRKDRGRRGEPLRRSCSRKHAKRQAEPWLIVASPGLTLSAGQILTIYARRMQIELGFRDLKSHRDGMAFEDSLTRRGHRIEILLLLHALATFAAWIVGHTCEQLRLHERLTPGSTTRRVYSLVRLGREAIVRRWSLPSIGRLTKAFRQHMLRLTQLPDIST